MISVAPARGQVLTYSPGARSAGTSNRSTISRSNGPHAPEHLQEESGWLIDAPVHAGLSLQGGGKVAVPDSELGILRGRATHQNAMSLLPGGCALVAVH